MTYIAWHFLPEDRRLRWGLEEVVEEGKTYRCEFPYNGCDRPTLCLAGMHGSFRAIDALYYAPGPVVCLTEIGGNVEFGDDKLVGEWRRVLRMADATNLLFEFACDVAEQALLDRQAEGVKISQASFTAVEVRRKWLRGQATDKDISAAESAAESSAESAARSAAWSAERSAARSAAESATWSVVRPAAGPAAWSAAWSAARLAARAAQNIELESRLRKLLGY